MKSVKWRVVLRSACRLASVSGLLFGAMTAGAADVVIGPPNKGTLYLETGAWGQMQFRWDKPQTEETNPPDIIQKIIDKSLTTWKLQDLCLVKLLESTPTPGGLVTLPANAGFIGDHIGIRSSSGLCSEISVGESPLALTLSGLLAGYQVYHTELNIEMKSRAVLQVDTHFGAGTQTFIILSPGASRPTSAPPVGPTVTDVHCTFANTSEHDICRWTTDTLWASATFKTLAGKVSIEGGKGGSGGAFSQFSLTKLDTPLPCAPAEGGLPIGVTVVDDPEHPQAIATVTRLKNSEPGECQPIQVAIEWNGPILQFFSADQGQSVATTFTITWPIEDAPNAGDNGVLGAIPLSKQKFQQANGSLVESNIDLCRGAPTGYVQDPDHTHPGEFLITGLDPDEDVADQSDLPGFQYGCAYEQRVTLPEAGKIAVKQWIYLSGDWGASRN